MLSQVIEKNQKILGTINPHKLVNENSSLDEINNIEEMLELPTQMFSPYRLLILTALWRWEALDFKSLSSDIKIKSDSNLISHLKVLENIELIHVEKEFDKKKPRTFYTLTPKGHELLKKLVKTLFYSLNEIVNPYGEK